jgi:hypothetical protein
MIFKKCIVCKSKRLDFSSKKKKVSSIISNFEKFGLNHILDNNQAEIINSHKCRRCKQRTVQIKNVETNETYEIWLEYVSKLKLIEKELYDIQHAIKDLQDLDKNSDVIRKKTQLLHQSYEVYKLKRDNLKHNMMASISIKLQTVIS